MVSDPFLVGLFFGLVPAMSLLYILLHRFEGRFNERRSFFAFFVGLGAGLVATLLQLFLGPAGQTRWGLLPVFAGLFGLVNVLLLTMVLNSRRYRGRTDTPFYGVAAGLGFGALNVLFLVGNAVRQLGTTRGSVLVEALSLSFVGLYFIGSILVHAAVGAWVGRGAARHDLLPEILRGTVAEATYFSGFFLLFNEAVSSFVPVVAVAAAIILIGYVLRTVLEPILPPEVRREMDVHRRRIARGVLRDVNPPSGTDPGAARTPGSPDEEARPPAPPSP